MTDDSIIKRLIADGSVEPVEPEQWEDVTKAASREEAIREGRARRCSRGGRALEAVSALGQARQAMRRRELHEGALEALASHRVVVSYS